MSPVCLRPVCLR